MRKLIFKLAILVSPFYIIGAQLDTEASQQGSNASAFCLLIACRPLPAIRDNHISLNSF
jgi:hypothetical protein